MSVITTKFGIGDVVWEVWNGTKEIISPCSFCAGEGDVSGADGERKSCPSCYGRRKHTTWEPETWRVVRKLTIGEVRVRASINDVDDEETYMAVETGIGSGSIHNVSNLYATEAEADATCKERNAQRGARDE